MEADGTANASEFDKALTFFPYGFQYHRAPTPLPEEWEPDLRRIAERGYTHIQLRPQWRCHERKRGLRVWDDLDKLFDLAGVHGLRVVLKPMLETAPDWVFTDFSATRIGMHGIPISPFAHGAYYVGGWWPCFDNPSVVEAASDFVRELVRRYKGHQALWMYDAWNEPVSRPLGQCQCKHSKTSYRKWLESQYGSIERLNETYGKAWTSFETIEPPVSGADYLEMFLWRKWAGHAVGGQVRFVVDAIRDIDANAHIMVHASASLVKQDTICATSNDMENINTGVDRYGTSFATSLHPKTPIEHADPELQSSWMRRVDASYWCHEFYPNHANWCRPPESGDLRRLIWSAIAGGAAGFTFWQYRSERVGCETNGYGLVNIDGSDTKRSAVADSIAAALKKHATTMAASKRIPSGIAILYSLDSDMISRIQQFPCGIQSASSERNAYDYPYKKAIAAAHALYHFMGLEPDWAVPGDNLDSCKLLHVPLAEMIDGKTAEWLKTFVRNGGKLVVELPFACRDSRTWVCPQIPDHKLDELLGCVEAERVLALETDSFSIDGADGAIPPGLWRTSLEKTGASSSVAGIWNDETPAVVKNKYGKGEVVSLGGSISLGFSNDWSSASFKALNGLLKMLDIKLPTWAGTGVIVNKRRCGKEDYHFAFNYSCNERIIDIPAGDPMTIDSEGARRSASGLRIAPGGVWVGKSRRDAADM